MTQARSGTEVALRGQGVRQKLFIVFAISAVMPLLAVLYLGLPLVRPALRASVFYPRDPIYFWVVLFFLAALELMGLYITVDIVRGLAALAEAVVKPAAPPTSAAVAGRADEVGLLMQEFTRLADTIRRQAGDARGYALKIEELHEELRAARRNLQDAALIDELTELGNQRLFDVRLTEEVERCRRFGHALTLVAVQLRAEDEATLRRAAGLFRSMCRAADVPCRLAGGTFALLLPETPKKAGLAVGERVRERLGSRAGSLGPDVAVHIAVAGLPDDGATAADLLAGAGMSLPTTRPPAGAGGEGVGPGEGGARQSGA